METEPQPIARLRDAAATTLACLWCHRRYRPKKSNQEYCRPSCRQKSHRYRKKFDAKQVQAPGPRLAPRKLMQAQQVGRLNAGVPVLRVDDYLSARALLIEADQQLVRWAAERKAREQALRALAPPPVRAEAFPLRAGDDPAVNLEATHGAIVSTDGEIGVMLFGYAHDSAAEKVQGHEADS